MSAIVIAGEPIASLPARFRVQIQEGGDIHRRPVIRAAVNPFPSDRDLAADRFDYESAFVFVLAGMLDRFVYLKTGVAFILVFVGLKMTLSAWVHISTPLSLAVIVTTLATAVILSLRHSAREQRLAA